MAMEKQERLLSQRPSIIVATPGRLWNLMSEVCLHFVVRVNIPVPRPLPEALECRWVVGLTKLIMKES